MSKIKLYMITIFFGATIFCLCMNLTGAVLSDVMIDYNIDLDNAGLMTLFQYSGGIAGVILLSKIADKLNKTMLHIMGFALMATTLFLISRYPSYPVFMLLYLLLGAGVCMVDVLNNAVLSDLCDENRNTMFSLIHGFCGAGAAFASILTVIVGTGNWRGAYSVVAVVICVVIATQLIAYTAGKKSIDICAARAKKEKIDPAGAKKFFKDKKIWFAVLSLLMYGVCQGGTTVWSVKYCREMFFEKGAVCWALSLSVYWIGTTACRLAIGFIPALKKWDIKKILFWGNILAGVAEFAGVISGSYIGVMVGFFVLGILSGMTIPGLVSLMNGWYPELSGLASSVSFIALYIGFAVIPLVMGLVAQVAGIAIIMMIPAAGVVISGIMGHFLPGSPGK